MLSQKTPRPYRKADPRVVRYERTQQSGDYAAERLLPFLLALFLTMMMQLPIGDGTGNVPVPHLTLMLVYYWSIHRPELLPVPAVAVIGLFQDLLWGGPPGLNMIVLLVARVILSNQQALFVRQSFGVGWAGFVPVVFLAMGLTWLIVCLYYGMLVSMLPLVGYGLVTLAAYPLLGWLFGRFDRFLKPD